MRSVKINKTDSFTLITSQIASDKSISHRSAMFALLAKGKSTINDFLRAEDTLNTLAIVKELGATVTDTGSTITVTSNGIQEPSSVLDCGNSGTGMRLFCGLLASADGHFVLTGDRYLCRRPMKRVTAPLRSIGANLDGVEDGNFAPLSIRGASLKAFDYKSPVASAQVKSAMILAALRADGVCSFEEPSLSRDHTELMLQGMGANIRTDGLKTYITPLEHDLKPLNIQVPSDPSSAFFFAVACAITPGSSLTIKGVTLNPTRIEAFKVLESMGSKISYTITDNRYEPIGDIKVEYSPLKAVTVESNIAWLIDELPALSIAMACAQGVSVVKNSKELRVKESDRISTVVNNLKQCSIDVEEFEDGYAITGGTLTPAKLDSFGDHRIAMSFIIAGLRCGMQMDDIECIQTSFPNFFELLSSFTQVSYED